MDRCGECDGSDGAHTPKCPAYWRGVVVRIQREKLREQELLTFGAVIDWDAEVERVRSTVEELWQQSSRARIVKIYARADGADEWVRRMRVLLPKHISDHVEFVMPAPPMRL